MRSTNGTTNRRGSALSFATALAASTLVGSPAYGQSPAFDCRKAQGEVEQLICKDAGLASLDRKLDEVYRAAMAKARDAMPGQLRAEQRGWVKGRNECWKAKGGTTYLTASWQVSGVRDCVEGQYLLRIAELQSTWNLVPSRPPAFFVCGASPANEIVATFYETDPSTVRLERGDRTVTAWRVRSASGAKYEGRNVEFWNKGDAASVSWHGEQLDCRVR